MGCFCFPSKKGGKEKGVKVKGAKKVLIERSKVILKVRSSPSKSQLAPPAPPAPSFIQFPLKIREKVWRFLDLRTRLSVRQTCSTFKQEIDIYAGLSFRLDNPGLLENPEVEEFLRSTEVVDLQYNCDTVVDKRIFRTWPNLEGLELNTPLSTALCLGILIPLEDTLISLRFDRRSLNTVYLAGRRAQLTHPDDGVVNQLPIVTRYNYHFPLLRLLTIEHPPYDFGVDLRIFCHNVAYLLVHLKAPKLAYFSVKPEEKDLTKILLEEIRLPREFTTWSEDHLKYFVHAHRHHLRHLHLLLFLNEFESGVDKQNYSPPTRLRHYMVLCPLLGQPVPGQNRNRRQPLTTKTKQLPLNEPEGPPKLYWRRILEHPCQNNLVSLVLQVGLWHDFYGLFMALPEVFSRVGETLRILSIESMLEAEQGGRNSGMFELNFSVFHPLKNLVKLVVNALRGGPGMVGAGNHLMGVGIIYLPQNLEYLSIRGIAFPSQELVFLRKFENLVYLNLENVGSKGPFGVNSTVLLSICKNPTIQKFHIVHFNLEKNRKKLVKMIKLINNGIYSYDVTVRRSIPQQDGQNITIAPINYYNSFGIRDYIKTRKSIN